MLDLNATVPIGSIVCMGISIAVIIFFPVFFYKAAIRRYKCKFQSILWGAFAYILAGLFLTNIAASGGYLLFTKAAGVDSPVFMGLNYVVATAVSVQLGILLLLKILLWKTQSVGNAVAMAIGYGGAEGVLMSAGVLLSNISMAMSINQNGLKNMVGDLSELEIEQMSQFLGPLLNTPSAQYLLIGFEQMGMIIFYVCSTLLLFIALTKKASFWLVGISILGHMSVLLPSALFQVKIIADIVLCELILLLVIAAFAGVTYYLIKRFAVELIEE